MNYVLSAALILLAAGSSHAQTPNSCCNEAEMLARLCNQFDGACNSFQADTDCWEDVLGLNVCYAKSSDDCCKLGLGGYFTIVCAPLFCLGCSGFIYWKCIRNKEDDV